MSEIDPHFRIGALTEALESTEKALEALVGRDSITPEAVEAILFSVRGSLRRNRESGKTTVGGMETPSEAFHRWLSCVRQIHANHIDGDPLNNELSNLELVSPKEHRRRLQGVRK